MNSLATKSTFHNTTIILRNLGTTVFGILLVFLILCSLKNLSGRQSLEQEQIVLMSERNSRSSTRRQTEALNEKIRQKEEIKSET